MKKIITSNWHLLAIDFRKTRIKIKANLIRSFPTKGTIFGCFPSYINIRKNCANRISKPENKKPFLSLKDQKKLFSAF
ncbi:MAG: hypothetical protein QXZ02_05960 [Candidatus Bathyarchaeia archaeon]